MKKLILLGLGLMASLVTFAQDNKRYTVKHGTRIKDTFKFNDIYLFPSFNSAKVYFITGDPGGGPMNYNRLTGEMDFIQGKDTLALGRENVKNVVIGTNLFFFQAPEGYLQRIDVIDKVVLAKSEVIQLADKRKMGTIDGFMLTPKSDGSYNSYVSGLPVTMVQSVDVIFELRIGYYLGNEKGNFKAANKKNLIKLFPEKKDTLTKYFEEHDVDFKNLEAIQNLFKDIREMK